MRYHRMPILVFMLLLMMFTVFLPILFLPKTIHKIDSGILSDTYCRLKCMSAIDEFISDNNKMKLDAHNRKTKSKTYIKHP